MNICKKIFGAFITAVFLLPILCFAQTGPQFLNVMFDQPLSVNPNPAGNYMVSTTLQLGTYSPYSALTIILVSSDDLDDGGEIIAPYHIVPLPNTIQTNGSAPISVELVPAQAGLGYKFFVVDTASLSAIGGAANFDPDNSAPFQVFGVSGGIVVSGGTPPDTTPTPTPTPPGTPGTTPTPTLFTYVPTTHIANPLNQDWDILTFLQKLFKNIVRIALPILVIFTVYAGFLFVEAQGNEEKLGKAKENLKYVIIGALIVLGSWTIASVIKGTVDQFEAYNMMHLFINLV